MVTLPGDITSATAGALLRRGAPVFVPGWPESNTVVLGRAITPGNFLVHPSPYHRIGEFGASMLVLDLTDDLGMDIAARWLARHHGLTVGATAPLTNPAEVLRLAILHAVGRLP